MSDAILIHGLRVRGVIGVYDFEQQAPRELILNLSLEKDLSAAAASDDLADTVDYAAVAALAQALAAERNHALLEHYGGRLLDAILEQYPVTAVDLEIRKPGAVEGADWVGVRMRRMSNPARY